MLESRPAPRSLMLVLHDVAPETWPDYQPFVEAVDAIGGVPMTWLVVPDFHQRNPLLRSPAFCRLLERRLAEGDELALHGYYHADNGPPPRTPGDFFMRRIYTHEGEFYGLDQQQALRQLPLRYTSTPQHLYRLPEFTPSPAPGLVWSARSAWRRGLSRALCDWQCRRWQNAETLRLGLHPVDMRHRSSREYWLNTLRTLMAQGREPLTKSDWLDRQVSA